MIWSKQFIFLQFTEWKYNYKNGSITLVIVSIQSFGCTNIYLLRNYLEFLPRPINVHWKSSIFTQHRVMPLITLTSVTANWKHSHILAYTEQRILSFVKCLLFKVHPTVTILHKRLRKGPRFSNSLLKAFYSWSIMFGTSKYLQYKTQSQNNWKHILTFRETTSHIVKSNEWRKTQSTSI